MGDVVTTFHSLEPVEDTDIETPIVPLAGMALCGVELLLTTPAEADMLLN